MFSTILKDTQFWRRTQLDPEFLANFWELFYFFHDFCQFLLSASIYVYYLKEGILSYELFFPLYLSRLRKKTHTLKKRTTTHTPKRRASSQKHIYKYKPRKPRKNLKLQNFFMASGLYKKIVTIQLYLD